MRKLLVVVALTLVSIFAIYLSLHLLWLLKEKKMLNVYILDKSVTKIDRPEHKSLTWILNNNRYVLPNSKSYSNTLNYFGFFPIDIKNDVFDFKSIRINEVDTYASSYDIAYYTDCYGVHSFEWYKGKSNINRSQKVFGGLNQNDYLLLSRMLDNEKLVICEYNMFSSPTNALVRTKTEDLFGISWSGWSGKYFETLDINSPKGPAEWMKNLFESQHMGNWPIEKSGIVLLNNDGLIELLIVDKDLNTSIPIIETNSNAIARFDVANSIPFEQWFEIVNPGNNIVHSNFIIDVTPHGLETLMRIGISNTFPAVLESPNSKKFFYFCGDFAENPSRLWTAKLSGGNLLNHVLCRFNEKNKANFFKYYYSPLMKRIFKEYYEHKTSKKN